MQPGSSVGRTCAGEGVRTHALQASAGRSRSEPSPSQPRSSGNDSPAARSSCQASGWRPPWPALCWCASTPRSGGCWQFEEALAFTGALWPAGSCICRRARPCSPHARKCNPHAAPMQPPCKPVCAHARPCKPVHDHARPCKPMAAPLGRCLQRPAAPPPARSAAPAAAPPPPPASRGPPARVQCRSWGVSVCGQQVPGHSLSSACSRATSTARCQHHTVLLQNHAVFPVCLAVTRRAHTACMHVQVHACRAHTCMFACTAPCYSPSPPCRLLLPPPPPLSLRASFSPPPDHPWRAAGLSQSVQELNCLCARERAAQAAMEVAPARCSKAAARIRYRNLNARERH